MVTSKRIGSCGSNTARLHTSRIRRGRLLGSNDFNFASELLCVYLLCSRLTVRLLNHAGIYFIKIVPPLSSLPVPSHLIFCQEPFREPVDWQALGLFDYPQVVKKPMDLGLVKKKLNEGKYKTIHDAADDIRLIWKNCMAYNADGSDFYNLAQVRTLLLSSRSLLFETAVGRVSQKSERNSMIIFYEDDGQKV